jgi:hypothetical protein
MELLKKYEDFKHEKEGLLNDAFNFKNKEIPVIQSVDDIKEEYTFEDIRRYKEKMLDQELFNIEKLLKEKTDYLPILEPWHAIGVHASAFGCETTWHKDIDATTVPVINNIMDVYDLKIDLANSELMQMTLDTINYFQNKIGTSIPITPCDPDGPTCCASLATKSDEFYMGFITNKKAIHHLIDLSTKIFIEFTERQFDILKNHAAPGHAFAHSPIAKGISVSADILNQLPPDAVEEFVIPPLEKIAARFDGVYIHSCGNWTHNLDLVLKMKGLKGINFHASPEEMDPEIVLKKIKKSGKKILMFGDFGQVGVKWTDNYKDDKDAYVNWYLKKILYNGMPEGVFISTFDNYPESIMYNHGFGRDKVDDKNISEDYDWIKSKIKDILKEK